MSLAYSLVNSLAETEMEEDLTTLVIDHYTREIRIPKGITTLGVEYDDDVLRLNFKMPRYLGTVDLYNFSIRINYINANGDDDVYKVTDKAIVGDDITFSWLVGPTAVAYKGNTKFNVCMVITDSNSVIKQEYNTAPVSLPVKEGLECSERVVSEYTDILEQWEHRLFGIGDTEEAKLLAFSEEQQENIANRGAEVLATIPEDYQTTTKLANEGARTKADAIICSAEGETVKMEDSSDDYLRGLKIFGKTTQVKTTGAQKLPFPYTQESRTTNGITYNINNDGSIKISGMSTAKAYLDLYNNPSPEIPGSHFLSGIPENSGFKMYAYSGGAYKEDTGNGVLLANGVTSVHVVVESGVMVNTTIYPMLNEGTSAMPWEPYTGGIPGPNPDYPQELVSIENPTAIIYGRNLVDIHQLELASNKSISISNDGYTITAVGGSNNTYSYSHYDLPVEVVYALRGRKVRLTSDSVSKSLENAYSPVQLNVKCADNTFHYPVNHSTKLYHEFTVPDNAIEIRFGIYTNNSATLLESDNTVVVKGVRLTLADDTDYEPYKPIGIVATDYTIPGIPVTSGGNYTDSDGQQWICDEIDFERGVYVQRCAHYIFDGSDDEPWRGMYNHEDKPFITIDVLRGNTQYNTPMVCNYALRNAWSAENVCFINNYDEFVIGGNPMASVLVDLNTFKRHIASTPIEIVYVLETPIETPLTVDELAAFQALKTNYPNTTVLNDAGAWMNLRYNADTETWINNLIDEKIAAAVVKL